jgi:hypothetical protein
MDPKQAEHKDAFAPPNRRAINPLAAESRGPAMRRQTGNHPDKRDERRRLL